MRPKTITALGIIRLETVTIKTWIDCEKKANHKVCDWLYIRVNNRVH